MKVFDKHIENGAQVTRIDGMFPIFLVENLMDDFVIKDFVISHGWGNGYVGIPSWHPYYKMDYNEIPIDCHCGLTWSSLDEDENLWVIGFDTSHSDDNKKNCSKKFVKENCLHIIDQCMMVKEAQRILKVNKLNNITDGRTTRSV